MWSEQDEKKFVQKLRGMSSAGFRERNGQLKFSFFIAFVAECDLKGKHEYAEQRK